MLPKPRRHVSAAAPEHALAFEPLEPFCVVRPTPQFGDGHDLRDGPITLEHGNGSARLDVSQVPRQAVLELPNLGLLHMAKLAKLEGRRQCLDSDTAAVLASSLDAGTQDRRGFDLDERAGDDERGNLDERRRRKITGEKRRARTSDFFAPARADHEDREPDHIC